MEGVETKPARSGSVKLVRAALTEIPKTFKEIKENCPGLKDGQISMSLCYLLRRNELVKEQVDRVAKYGRRRVFTYALKKVGE